MDSATKLRSSLNKWYTRYLTSTELYMVEPWEKVVVHVLLAVIFGLFWYFNCSIIVNIMSQVRGSPQNIEEL